MHDGVLSQFAHAELLTPFERSTEFLTGPGLTESARIENLRTFGFGTNGCAK